MSEKRKAEDYRKRQRRDREDHARGYHQWQPRRSPRKSKLFEVDRGKTLIVLVSSEFALSIFVMLYILFIVNI